MPAVRGIDVAGVGVDGPDARPLTAPLLLRVRRPSSPASACSVFGINGGIAGVFGRGGDATTGSSPVFIGLMYEISVFDEPKPGTLRASAASSVNGVCVKLFFFGIVRPSSASLGSDGEFLSGLAGGDALATLMACSAKSLT